MKKGRSEGKKRTERKRKEGRMGTIGRRKGLKANRKEGRKNGREAG